jgi:hypothetical protein
VARIRARNKEEHQMRSKRRVAAVLALATAVSLAVAGVAYAAISSTVSLKFTPSNLPTTTFANGSLNVHTHTNYSDVGSQYTDQAQLNFDNDIKVNTSAKPKCNKANISGTKTMAQAMTACGSSLIGTGTATAAAGANTVHACVLAFNGSGTGGHVLLFTRANAAPPFTITCSNPSSNTQGNTNVLLDGALSTNPSSLGSDYAGGKQLKFVGIHAASPLPLTDFNVTVGKPSAPTYASARCHDSDHKLNLKTKFTYSSGTQTVSSSQTCS